jgi:flagellar M-ring protein FliF
MPSGSPDLKYQSSSSAATAGKSSSGFKKENSVVNYEINRVNKQIVSSVGDITRLTAAVIIDGPYKREKGADGEIAQTFTPRSRREMKTFEEIVKKAIGYDETRQDQVTVSNIPFAMQKEAEILAEQQSESPWITYIKKATRPALNVLLIGLFFLLAVRPFRKWLNQVSRQQALLKRGPDTQQLEAGAEGGHSEKEQQTQLLEIAKKNPEMAADIIRGWLSEGGR